MKKPHGYAKLKTVEGTRTSLTGTPDEKVGPLNILYQKTIKDSKDIPAMQQLIKIVLPCLVWRATGTALPSITTELVFLRRTSLLIG